MRIFRPSFKAGGLKVTSTEQRTPRLSAPMAFTAPTSLNHSSYCLPSNDQGNTSACAIFTVCGWGECHDWRQTHIPKQLPAPEVYQHALESNNLPDDSGLTFTQAIEAAQDKDCVPKIYKLQPVDFGDIRYAFHKHGLVLFGFNISSNWNRASRRTGKIASMRRSDQVLGGHAVLGTGFNPYGPWFQNSWLPWGKDGFGQMSWEQCKDDLIIAFVLVHK